MQVVKGDPVIPIIWEEYRRLIEEYEEMSDALEYEDRFDFMTAQLVRMLLLQRVNVLNMRTSF